MISLVEFHDGLLSGLTVGQARGIARSLQHLEREIRDRRPEVETPAMIAEALAGIRDELERAL